MTAILGIPAFYHDIAAAQEERFTRIKHDRLTRRRPIDRTTYWLARESTHRGFVAEFFGFLRQNKKWWLWLIVVIFLVFGLLIFLSDTGFAPFVYTLF